MKTVLVLFAVALITPALSGCVRVRPFEREILSIRPMNSAVEGGENQFRQHWQESREGGPCGYASAGGGCGCN
jgi:hypothetical protein